jgi:hypothetical protein
LCMTAFWRTRLPDWVIFDRDEVSSKSRHVGCAPESGSKIRVLAFVMTDPGGLMMPPGA